MSRNLFLDIFEYEKRKKIPRAELWIGNSIFENLGLKNNIQSRLQLCQELGMDCFFFPLSLTEPTFSPCTYQYFTIPEVRKYIDKINLPLGVILDGPFQHLCRKWGIFAALSLLNDPDKLHSEYKETILLLASAIALMTPLKLDAVVLADDIAYHETTYFSLNLFETLIAPYYREIVNMIHEGQCLAMFHSDGNWSNIFPSLVDCGFDGFAGCQWECMDLVSLKQIAKVFFMTGIDLPLLESDCLGTPERKTWGKQIKALFAERNFVLTSSCGMHAIKHFENLKQIYKWMDELIFDE